MFAIGDLVTVRSPENITPIPSYVPRGGARGADSYYAITNKTLRGMSAPGNLYRIAEIKTPAPDFDESHEPVAYRLMPENYDMLNEAQKYSYTSLYFLENMLEQVTEEEIEAPDGDLSDFLFGGIAV